MVTISVNNIFGRGFGGALRGCSRLCGVGTNKVKIKALGAGQAFLLFSLMALGMTATGSQAEAGFTYCNKTSYVLKTAIAYDDGGWTSKGWEVLLPGGCTEILEGELKDDTYYTYAESLPGHKGGIKYFAGESPFCVSSDENFELGDRENCSDKGLISGRFVEVAVDGQKEWTTTFTEPKTFTRKKAEIAGAQRLLADIGFDPGRIDGELGRKTRQAIAAFKRAHDLSVAGLISEELMTTLTSEASKEANDLGYKFCNQTQNRVWAAIGFQGKKNWVSRGWWALDPGVCAKVIKDALNQASYYVHAVMEQTSGEKPLSVGSHELCTAEAKFEIEGRSDCEVRGYTTAGFAKIDIGGEKSYTQTFTIE